MHPEQAPWTDIGSVQSDIRTLQSEIGRKANDYEIHEVNRKLDSLECAYRALSSSLDGIRIELQMLQEKKGK